ncbi:kunitz-type serine protease inhibitor textilinin-2 [Drosophila takahashii]|uniref:kunitz-type serine protease inhibitor textilinin-2 n=1 Tax=Drosophila takahashii TaxID=29030 RepID=UPI0007E6B91F|nr:kunitz-type serine protease inhibitor textilinin-2 [Drosophila takahashii]
MKVGIVILGLLAISVSTVQPARNRLALCYLPQQFGKCGGHRLMWAFSNQQQMCVPFVFSNCGGNENRFFTKEKCEKTCAILHNRFVHAN